MLKTLPLVFLCLCTSFFYNAQCSNFSDSINFVKPGEGLCNGQISVFPIGGTLPYSYSWNNGSNTQTITGLCTGYYTGFVTDALGCVDSFYVQLNSICSDFNVASSFYISDTVNCNGVISSYAGGGLEPYVFNWNTGASSSSLTNLCQGNYQLVVTDANGCADTNSISLMYNDTIVPPCDSFYADVNSSFSYDSICSGSISVYATSNFSPITYTWNNGATSSSIFDLCSGVYSYTVTDAIGCSQNDTVVIYTSSTNFTMTAQTTDETVDGMCDGTVNIEPVGGFPPFSYQHSNGGTSSYITNLCTGYYSVDVTDGNGQIFYVGYVISNSSSTYYDTIDNSSYYPYADTLNGFVIENCIVNYSSIDSAVISGFDYINVSTINITWAIYSDTSSVVYINEEYHPGFGDSIYTFVISVYCPTKALGDYFKVYGQLYLGALNSIENGQLELEGVLCYPDPFKDNLTLKFKDKRDYKIQLMDISGRVIQSYELFQNDQIHLTDLEKLNNGSYFLKIDSESFHSNIQLMK